MNHVLPGDEKPKEKTSPDRQSILLSSNGSAMRTARKQREKGENRSEAKQKQFTNGPIEITRQELCPGSYVRPHQDQAEQYLSKTAQVRSTVFQKVTRRPGDAASLKETRRRLAAS
jgi:hypothetical protein